MRALFLALLLCGCASPPVAVLPRAPANASVFLVPQGGHTGIAVRRADIPAPLIPEKQDFPGADHLEFGWGDRDFYMSESPGPWVTFKAAFLPTRSVVHVAGVRGDVKGSFSGSEVLRVPVTREGLERLLHYVHDAFERPAGGTAEALGKGFYAGRETFHLLRTCNIWTAGALRAAGLPVRNSITVEGIMSQVRPLAVR